MKPIINFTLFVFILLQTDASVLLHEEGAVVGNGFFECGEPLVLFCTIESYKISMAWQNDSSSVPLARCLLNTCTIDVDVQNKFLFTYHTGTGIFNLTFEVSIYNNGTTYTCSDGSNPVNSLVLTKDYRPTLSYKDGKLKAACGCIDEHVNVIFKLIVHNVNETCWQPFEHANVVTDNSSCLTDTKCGAPNSIQKYAILEAEQDQGGYQILVEATYDDKTSVTSFLTKEKYKIPVCVKDDRICIVLFIMITFWILDVILIVIQAIAFCCNCYWKQIEDREIYLHVTCLAIIVAAVQILISFIVFVIKISHLATMTVVHVV